MSGPTHLSRRTTLGLAGAAVLGSAALIGCTASPSPTQAAASRAADADVALVGQARTQIADRLDLVRRTTRRHPGLGPTLRPLVGLHQQHAEVLATATSGGSTTPAPADDSTAVPRLGVAALVLVRSQERALQAELASLALRATSGSLARALASMSAGVAQRGVLLAVAPGVGEAS